MAAQLSKMSYIFKRSCTLLSKVVTTYTTLVTLQLWKVAKVVESTIGRFPDVLYARDRSVTSRITGCRELNHFGIRHASQSSVNTTENNLILGLKNAKIFRQPT